MAGIPALPKHRFGKKWSYKVLTPQQRYVLSYYHIVEVSRWFNLYQSLANSPDNYVIFIIFHRKQVSTNVETCFLGKNKKIYLLKILPLDTSINPDALDEKKTRVLVFNSF